MSLSRLDRPGPYKPLSDREWQVVDGIRRDLAYKQIAHELSLSYDTVRNYVKNAAAKFNNPDNLEPRVVIRLWAIHAVWANGRAQVDEAAA